MYFYDYVFFGVIFLLAGVILIIGGIVGKNKKIRNMGTTIVAFIAVSVVALFCYGLYELLSCWPTSQSCP